MKYVLFFLLTGLLQTVSAQTAYRDSVAKLRELHLAELQDTAAHILKSDEIAAFEGLHYFEADEHYKVQAVFTRSKGKKFQMATSTARLPVYRRYGYLDFTIAGESCRLTIYESMDYKDYLFIPFRDANTAKLTYGAGRYLDIPVPASDTIEIDFNLAYNPYCAYSIRYSCPIPPPENTLKVAINAGEQTPAGHD
jgi:uncharacterized protein (DUF1684 family)